MEGFAAWAEASTLGQAARGGSWTYPVANLVHLLGLALLIGPIGIVDLRLAGAFRSLPLSPLSRALTPLAIGGLVLLGLSGVVLFSADARTLIHSPLLRAKLLLILIALSNAMAFRLLWGGKEPVTPWLRMIAVVSIALWLTVAALGRLIAYT
ncbi:hypothetical protein Q4F19_07625 [Sphingomonas sp. BIUV-7]|uniref:DUF6644 domain-containing protein n=1 Tax=Sphingomonas natans TaxID=3063330 RepID=A0ABT8Y7F3_9SPHN|nr:DUF6644 family protein [Sphingomonas sp. BIUV-7]MDO6414248.1 hypothetical protein [Sphingomonas sp. BIUV-7]